MRCTRGAYASASGGAGREEGRKRKGLGFHTSRTTHTRNAVCKCVQSDGSILQAVVPALIPLSLSLICASLPPLPPPPLLLPRAPRPPGFLPAATHGRVNTSPCSPAEDTTTRQRCNPIDRLLLSFLDVQRVRRLVARSVPRRYFAGGAGKRAKSRLRRMNKILFSLHTTQNALAARSALCLVESESSSRYYHSAFLSSRELLTRQKHKADTPL